MPLMPEPDALLTSADVGQLLGKSPRTVIRMAEAGTLPYEQKLPGIRGAYLFRRSDIEAYQQDVRSAVA